MSDKSEPFCADYYLNGVKSGLSNYENYRYLGAPTTEMAYRWLRTLDVGFGDVIIDYGCARGYFVRALRELGKNARGVDLSIWAIENGDETIKEHLSNDLTIKPLSVDWINAKDVLEHIPIDELVDVVKSFAAGARKGFFIIVPLTDWKGIYLREEDRKDVTHQIAWELQDWLKFLSEHCRGFVIQASYHIPGLKPASDKVPFSCGFFTLKRIK